MLRKYQSVSEAGNKKAKVEPKKVGKGKEVQESKEKAPVKKCLARRRQVRPCPPQGRRKEDEGKRGLFRGQVW